eukprot:7545169-Pyramimonas_sp.AAC.1
MALWRKRGSRALARPRQPHHSRGNDIPDFGGSPLASRSSTDPVRVGGARGPRRPRTLWAAKRPQVEQCKIPFSTDKEWVSWQWMANG